MFVIFQLYSLIGFMFPEDSSPAFALFKFVQVIILFPLAKCYMVLTLAEDTCRFSAIVF